MLVTKFEIFITHLIPKRDKKEFWNKWNEDKTVKDGSCFLKEYPSETHLKPKAREIMFAHHILFRFFNVIQFDIFSSKFCIAFGSITSEPYAAFKDDLIMKIN